ncbi:alpha/beta fold hydrolase [Glaciimonas soli]|uniref:X-Pro dipeptidyl-peptidase n=1 Tax=Glaciimonas soli TaxID=2590999 RepID=A0A843YZI2_9BURK|nr:alpha/beta fold hydrolase [Glaciimonas soli]MQR02632.1 X-Pro dipeptidyl-peptidase [Glaciimonas soli]
MRQLANLLVMFVVALAVVAPVAAQTPPGSLVSIPTIDGYRLGAYVSVPTGQGSGPFPLVVMPSSWGLNFIEYIGEANTLASNGYIVVSYSSRGFDLGCAILPQCGYIDIAGPLTVGDVSTVITWALAHTPSDPNKIGVSGISYGAGTSLLAAENDTRIKAVASMSTWASLENSLYANQTPSTQGIGLLSFASYIGKPGPLMQTINQNVAKLNFYGAVQSLLPVAAQRDPITSVAQLNANGTAVFVANAFEDSLFVPSQLVNLYNQLTVPKMMMFSHGDHATSELLGAVGLPNEVYAAANSWFDHYLKGVNNGINTQQPVQVKSQTGVWKTYANWNAVQQGTVTYNLTQPTGFLGILPTGNLSSGSGGNWQYGITGGYLTAATSGVVLLSGALTGYLDLPPPVALSLVNRSNAAVWMGPVFTQTKNLLGIPSLQITVTPNSSQFTLVAYLYSVNQVTGIGQLITQKPYTNLNATQGAPLAIKMNLEATNWEIDPGNQLALVIGTADLRYTSVTPVGSAVTFSSSTATPSTLSVSLQ